MPKTKTQAIVFGLLMSVFMTTGMELYNNAVKLGIDLMPGGLSNMDWTVVGEALKELPIMVPVVFIISNLYGNRAGRALASKFIDPERDSAFFARCVTIACTTLVMCPSMSLFASLLFNVVLAGRPLTDLPVIWLGTIYKNFAIALLWNLFAASPATTLCFGAIFGFSRSKTSSRRAFETA